jgi:linoleate 10R-lipoxygenase
VNYYLSEERKDARTEIVALTAKNTKEANEKITGMVKEALCADPPVQGVYRTALKDEVLSDSTKVKAGERVFVDIATANKDVSWIVSSLWPCLIHTLLEKG